MREIKFRAWNPDSKEMIIIPNNTGSYFHFGENNFISTPSWFVSNNGASCAYSDRSHLMQFTGLLDRNGKEIYEGDICRIDVGSKPSILRECRFTFGAFHLGRRDDFVDTTRYEVIGNVYENPELLTQKQL